MPVLTSFQQHESSPTMNTCAHYFPFLSFSHNTMISNPPFVPILVDNRDYQPLLSISYYLILPLSQSPQIINSWKAGECLPPLPLTKPHRVLCTWWTLVLRQTFSDTAPLSCCHRVGVAQLPGFIAFPWRGNYNALSSLFGFKPVALHLVSNFLFV